MVELINAAFETFYWLLVAALVLLVPIWFGKFLIEVAATILEWRRQKRGY